MAQRKSALIVYSGRTQEIRGIKRELQAAYPEWRLYFEVEGKPEHKSRDKFNLVIMDAGGPLVAQVKRELDAKDPEKSSSKRTPPAARKPGVNHGGTGAN